MKVYVCNDFKGCYPVGAAAVIVAESLADAARILSDDLLERGLEQEIKLSQIKELNTEEAHSVVLCDGNY